ncbi:hypothetical protein [Pseudomonas atacamensis]|uniref:hypothetical protein n=1 Tax=Pseudomonas atacamensis TaxID=2565368 RepID=UPI0019D2BDAB|nr:hypothetical protein [Pseudomonas atacamensis]QSL86218.1 hypothetical protein JWU58_18845 [Pseudomonas atacamensis]
MPYVYEGPASVTVMARYLGLEWAELTTLECPVRLLNAGRVRVELQYYLQGPKAANTLRVMLPHGMMAQGPILDGWNQPTGGWLLIDVEQYDLAYESPGSSKGWQWR